MFNFILGFLAGFISNWLCGIAGRALPATLVRYDIEIKNPEKEKGLGGEVWLAPITISPPRWRKILMSPLAEYLLVEVWVPGMQWIRTKWDKGDWGETLLRADAAMTIPCLILSSLGHTEQWYIADRGGERDYQLVKIPACIKVRIVRTLDNKIGDERTITVKQDEGKLLWGDEGIRLNP